ncbi:uncharacterized protein LOC108736039, partial [Agrilus planipennis]|uniref:Uncharacterized protein LOC108736039 n=1 Tax=Agrilus planipennis TaxID=224129 RepID=A0A1W4WIN4_AGRPL
MIDEDVACIEIQEPFLSYEYKGDRDKDEGKSGLGTHIWTFTKVKQKYEGNFFQNTLHGFGDLLIEKQFHYTGYFFANCYEGYGRIKYFNGNIFEGLFKDNKKFGPGVFTYPFGAQDVGFWAGGSLIRLCCNNSVDLIPEITRSYDGKKYIQKFKKAITFQYPPFDEAKDILRKLNVDESDGIAERKDELYNRFLRQKCSLAFDNNKFEKMYFAAPACEDNPMITESSSLSNESAVSWEGDCPLKSLFTKEILLQEIKDQIEIVDVLVYYLQLQKQSIEQDSTENLYVSHEEDEYVDDYGSYNTEYILKNLEELHPWLKDSIENIEIGLQGNGLSTFQKKKFESFEDSLENLERINHLFLLMEQLKLYLTNKYEQLATKKNRERKRTGSSNKENEEFSNSVLEVRSWNNNQWIIDMVAHCHQYKQKEDTLSFDISDFRNRLNFSVCGPHESDCLCFMLQCAFGRTIDIINLCKRSVNPNVSNCKGNSGVFFAVAFDNIKVLKALTELGADLNVYNDECLTPLILSICRLLALMYNINDWEKAFMPSSVSTSPKQQESTNDLNLWHLHSQSEESGNSRFILPPSIEKKIFDNKQTLDRKSVGHQEFILSTECRKVSLKKIKKNKKDKKGSKKGRDKKEKD